MTAKIHVPIEDQTLTRKKILLVEDNDIDAELTLGALRKNNIMNDVVLAHDGEEALRWLFGEDSAAPKESESLPAVVLLDLKLPRVDGLEVLRRIRRHPRTSRLPVVVLTSSRAERDVMQVYDLGANSFIHKPIDFEKFADAVGHLGMYWVLFNEMPPVAEQPAELVR